MMRKKIFYLVIICISLLCKSTFGNEQKDKDQKFIELIKKTYANKKFPLTYAFNVLVTLCNELENESSLSSLIDQEINKEEVKKNNKMLQTFNPKQLSNIKNALYIIRNSGDFIKEVNLKKKYNDNLEIEYELRNMNDQIKSIKKYMFFLVSIIGVDLIFKTKCFYILDIIRALIVKHNF